MGSGQELMAWLLLVEWGNRSGKTSGDRGGLHGTLMAKGSAGGQVPASFTHGGLSAR